MIRAALLCLLASPALAEVRFTDLSDTLPPHSYTGGWEHFVGGGIATFDCNGDTLPDAFVAGGDSPAQLLLNQGGMRFTSAPLPPLSGVTGAYPIDLDGDAALDLYVLRVGPDIALRGGPDCTFTEATIALGLPRTDQWSTAFTAWWAPGADRPTLAIGHYVDRADPEGPFEACDSNTLLTPTPTGYAAMPLEPGFCALSMLAGADARGRPTLRISNDRHYYVRGGSEQMWDIAEARFLTQADGWDGPALWGMGIASRDLTGDGRDEVMLTSMGDQLLQLAGPDGRYRDAPYAIGTYATTPHTGEDGRPSTGWHAEFGDVDNDGRADLFIAKGNVDQMPGMAIEDPNNLLLQQPDGTFQEAAARAGVADPARSRGATLADFDGDGDLDLMVVNRRAPLRLYRNDTAPVGNWLQIDLAQPGGNAHAIGAVVTVNGQTLQRRIGGGHAGGSHLPLHIGLGDASEARITVTWPDGTTTRHTAAANQRLTLTP